jgi:uncharacterized membrane protein
MLDADDREYEINTPVTGARISGGVSGGVMSGATISMIIISVLVMILLIVTMVFIYLSLNQGSQLQIKNAKLCG